MSLEKYNYIIEALEGRMVPDMQKLVISYVLTDIYFAKNVGRLLLWDKNRKSNNISNNKLNNFISKNGLLFEFLWYKYISTNLPADYKYISLDEFKNIYYGAIYLYDKNVHDITNNTEYKKYEILYKNATNILKIHKNLKHNTDELLNSIVCYNQLIYKPNIPFTDEAVCLLSEAVLKGDILLVKKLINLGADINILDSKALSNAFKINMIDMIKLLLDNGADPTLDMSESAPIIQACEKGNLEIVKLLLDKGVKINKTYSRDDKTPLMQACYYGYYDIVQLLINKGANVNFKNESGKNAMYYALRGKHDNIETMLLKNGENTDRWERNGIKNEIYNYEHRNDKFDRIDEYLWYLQN